MTWKFHAPTARTAGLDREISTEPSHSNGGISIASIASIAARVLTHHGLTSNHLRNEPRVSRVPQEMSNSSILSDP